MPQGSRHPSAFLAALWRLFTGKDQEGRSVVFGMRIHTGAEAVSGSTHTITVKTRKSIFKINIPVSDVQRGIYAVSISHLPTNHRQANNCDIEEINHGKLGMVTQRCIRAVGAMVPGSRRQSAAWNSTLIYHGILKNSPAIIEIP